MITKICSKCNRELPATEEYFTTHPTCSFGLSNKCKDCTSEYMKQRRVIKGKEIDKKNLPYARAWKQRNKEKVLHYMENWRKENADKIKEDSKNYYDNHKEEIMEKVKNWGENNPDKKREYRLKSVFGISSIEYEERLEKQKGVCAICGLGESARDKNGKIRPLTIDHNHSTGEIRGLLCSRCNCGLGQFKDSPDILKTAMEYIIKGGF